MFPQNIHFLNSGQNLDLNLTLLPILLWSSNVIKPARSTSACRAFNELNRNHTWILWLNLAGTRALQAPQRPFGPILRILWQNHTPSIIYRFRSITGPLFFFFCIFTTVPKNDPRNGLKFKKRQKLTKTIIPTGRRSFIRTNVWEFFLQYINWLLWRHGGGHFQKIELCKKIIFLWF